MISHDHRCVFVHVPKTAGQSIEQAFLDSLNLTWETRAPLLLRPNDDPELGPPRLAHLKADEYVRYGYLSPESFGKYFKFAFVRNPWDRLVSLYRYLRFPRKLEFKSFLQSFGAIRRSHEQGWFLAPQHEFVCDEHGNLLVDFIGRFEHLPTDFQRVCRALAMSAAPLPHRNETRTGWWSGKRAGADSATYGQYYDDESRELAAEICRRDIELFGYGFEAAADPDPAGRREPFDAPESSLPGASDP